LDLVELERQQVLTLGQTVGAHHLIVTLRRAVGLEGLQEQLLACRQEIWRFLQQHLEECHPEHMI
jgi:hypothetical protein